ncbi:MAG: glutamine--fructose-6-phosphate transaminase (isomerizing) [Bacilli bacterium]|nr:glutamine--fructose-6-phosphate transaminase (isomerizing) [Bacilli bacterium]
MCGIVGYIGSKKPNNILIEGLKTLEYRGYDSSGIALQNKEKTQIIKSVGKIKNLEEKIKEENLINANIGIAHTRWATHGKPNESNAHPHKVGKITIVHNGIIENASVLRNILESQKIKLNSETDTEVVAALINYYYQDNIIEAINQTINKITGSYALGIMVEGDENLYAIRKDSPLVIGIGDKEHFIASDIAAIIDHTNKYILLEENEIATISQDNCKIQKDGKEIKKQILETDISAESRDKCGYEYYMMKEIMEQPVLLENTLKPLIKDLTQLPDLTKYEEIHIVACGSAIYAGMIGKTLLEDYANIKVTCEVASEYRYKKVFYSEKTLVILISQSGETADTIAAMRKAKYNGVDTLAIVNVKSSTIARESKKQIYIEAGPEIAVATTKAYLLQVAILALLSYKATKDKNGASIDLAKEIEMLPRLVKEIIDRRESYLEIAKSIYNNNDIFFIGRKIDYAISLEGSLKLKEISYIHSEAYQAGELKHGTISLIEKGTPVIAIVTDKIVREKTISNIEEVKSRGAKIIAITNSNLPSYDFNISVPKISDFFQPILIIPCLQLIAYEVAKLRGCDIDKPKNLAKSVTVE